ncbi:MAG: LysR family transcriptional regulator [Myxococcales bacterium]|nr:LysR family transcriptional regulator [Myxococcales bacterium]MCB9580842.1 LysR family transcriptional regulator [Polyangiaceae bacterium]
MDWTPVGFDWNRARAFLVTAEEGSFSAAARALGQAQPTLGRQIAALEQELGVSLFQRVGNALELTPTGLELLEHVRTMSEAAGRISLSAAGKSMDIDGVVTLAASEAISAYLLPPIVKALRAAHPGIEVEIVASNATTDLRRREADIALRNFRPTDPELFAKKLKDHRAWLYATPEYLASIGNPKSLAALSARAEVLAFDRKKTFQDALNGIGFSFGAESFPIRTENHLVQWELAKSGAGLCVMMEEVGDREPKVRRVLPKKAPCFPFPSWLTSHRELATSRRIRVVYDFVASAFVAL